MLSRTASLLAWFQPCEPNYRRNRVGKVTFFSYVLDVELRPAGTVLYLDSTTSKVRIGEINANQHRNRRRRQSDTQREGHQLRRLAAL